MFGGHARHWFLRLKRLQLRQEFVAFFDLGAMDEFEAEALRRSLKLEDAAVL